MKEKKSMINILNKAFIGKVFLGIEFKNDWLLLDMDGIDTGLKIKDIVGKRIDNVTLLNNKLLLKFEEFDDWFSFHFYDDIEVES